MLNCFKRMNGKLTITHPNMISPHCVKLMYQNLWNKNKKKINLQGFLASLCSFLCSFLMCSFLCSIFCSDFGSANFLEFALTRFCFFSLPDDGPPLLFFAPRSLRISISWSSSCQISPATFCLASGVAIPSPPAEVNGNARGSSSVSLPDDPANILCGKNDTAPTASNDINRKFICKKERRENHSWFHMYWRTDVKKSFIDGSERKSNIETITIRYVECVII